ncbi:hypothetical protein KAW64_02840 [bacterium]|nr:hypothetical protein [bacterium]
MNNRILLAALLGLLVLAAPAWSEGGDTCLAMADSLAGAGFADAAITEYMRFMFFHPESVETAACHSSISRCYAGLGDLKRALDSGRAAVSSAEQDSLKYHYRLNVAAIHLEMGDVSMAELAASRVLAFCPDRDVRERAVLMIAECQLRTYRWKELRGTFSMSEMWRQGQSWARIDSMLSALESINAKSPDMARRLSTFVPGTGQMYAGDALDGLHALALNALLGSLLVSSVMEGMVGECIVYFSLLKRYYQGNRANAARLSEEHNIAALEPYVQGITAEIRTARE